MRVSKKKRSELYAAIREPIVDVRIRLKLPADKDVVLAQVEHEIWKRQKKALGLPESG